MHPNEIRINAENLMELIMSAPSEQHFEALKEQVIRQHPENEELLGQVVYPK